MTREEKKLGRDLYACGVIHEHEDECPKEKERLYHVVTGLLEAAEKFEASMETVQ